MNLRSTFVRLGCCVCLLAGCGGAEDADGPTTEETSTGGEEQSSASTTELAWEDMDRPQRLAFMQETVMPEMQAMFQEHDAERFAEFSCATCHGDNMQEADFAMPNGVAPLDPAQLGAMFASEQPMAQFMTQRVWPRMAELLQEAPYDPETHAGFGCLNCHATAEGG